MNAQNVSLIFLLMYPVSQSSQAKNQWSYLNSQWDSTKMLFFFSQVSIQCYDTSIFHLLPCKVVLLMLTRKPHVAGRLKKAASDEIQAMQLVFLQSSGKENFYCNFNSQTYVIWHYSFEIDHGGNNLEFGIPGWTCGKLN